MTGLLPRRGFMKNLAFGIHNVCLLKSTGSEDSVPRPGNSTAITTNALTPESFLVSAYQVFGSFILRHVAVVIQTADSGILMLSPMKLYPLKLHGLFRRFCRGEVRPDGKHQNCKIKYQNFKMSGLHLNRCL